MVRLRACAMGFSRPKKTYRLPGVLHRRFRRVEAFATLYIVFRCSEDVRVWAIQPDAQHPRRAQVAQLEAQWREAQQHMEMAKHKAEAQALQQHAVEVRDLSGAEAASLFLFS